MSVKKILIVDDLEKIRDLVKTTLLRGEYEVLQAESGEKAVETAKIEKPDLIIMDIMMPGKLDGLDATRIIKNDPETKNCSIIVLTGKGQDSDREEGIRAGADDYFIKPFSPLKLLKKVDEVLGV